MSLVLALTLLNAAAAADDDLPGWMAGCWTGDDGGAWSEECWSAPRGGSMMGHSRSGRGTELSMWEATQIMREADGTVTFWASPRGAARSPFPIVSRGAAEIVFANPAHDYPQRLRYWREGDTLHAEISLADGSKPYRFRFRRAR